MVVSPLVSEFKTVLLTLIKVVVNRMKFHYLLCSPYTYSSSLCYILQYPSDWMFVIINVYLHYNGPD